MELLAPVGPVYQAGTLSGNPLATAAGLATLTLADDAVYATVAARAREIGEIVGAALDAEGVAHRVQRSGSLFSVVFGAGAAERGVRDYEEHSAAANSADGDDPADPADRDRTAPPVPERRA